MLQAFPRFCSAAVVMRFDADAALASRGKPPRSVTMTPRSSRIQQYVLSRWLLTEVGAILAPRG